MTDTLRLQFGANQFIIPGLKAAWGARLIVTQDGFVDLPWDRQGNAGDEEILNRTHEWLNGGALKGALEIVRTALREGRISTRAESPIWVYEDKQGIMLGDTNASAGYFYLVGWLFEALPEGHPTKGAERLVERIKALRVNPFLDGEGAVVSTWVYVEKYGIEVCHKAVQKPVRWTGGGSSLEWLPFCGARVDVASLERIDSSYPPFPVCARCERKKRM